MVGKRISREIETIEKMMHINCRDKHGILSELCEDCQELLEYAKKRLNCCPQGEDKPVCGNCLIHCYKPDMREKIIGVMRYAGPRMTYKHPILALHHVIDSRKKTIKKEKKHLNKQ